LVTTEEMTMTKVSAAQRKHIRDQKARALLAARHARMLRAKKTGKTDIPDKIMKQLGSLNLPPNPFVYEAVLEKLLRGA
jgi:hypothetical protein